MSRIKADEYLEYLYGRLPTQWRLLDQEEGLPLYNYLKVIVYGGLEKNIDLANKFTELTDPVRCPSPFFPTLYESIGLKYDWGISEVYQRRVFQNIGELMRRRGSYNSIRYLIRVLTGMECNLDYQRSPVKSYENTDLVAFQGYNKGDITVLEMKGETTQDTTEGYNVFNIVGSTVKVGNSGDCRVKVYDNGVVEVTGNALSDSTNISIEYAHTAEEKKKFKPGIYHMVVQGKVYPNPYFKASLNSKDFMEVNKNYPTMDVTQRMLDAGYNFYSGVWGIKSSKVIAGIVRPYVVCDSDNPNMFDVYGVALRDTTYQIVNYYSFSVTGTLDSSQAYYDVITEKHFSEYGGKTIYVSGEVSGSSVPSNAEIVVNCHDGVDWLGATTIMTGKGKFKNVPYVVPQTGKFVRVAVRVRVGTFTLNNIRVTEKPYVDDNKVSTGVQLIDANKFPDNNGSGSSGVTITNNHDGSITAKGTASTWVTSSFSISLQPGTYTPSGSKNKFLVFVRIFKDRVKGVYKDYANTFTVTSDDTDIMMWVQVDKGSTVNDTVWPMLNAGSTAKPWEPFTYGIPVKGHVTPTELYEPYSKSAPSPSIEFRQPFHNVGDPVNLIKLRLPSRTSNGITYTNNGDGTFSITGTNTLAAENTTFRIDQTDGNQSDITLYEPGYYSMYFEVMEGENTSEEIGLALYSPGMNKTYVSEATAPLYVSETIRDGTIVLIIKGGKTVNSKIRVQLQKGCFCTDWKPYSEGGVYEFITSKGRRNLLSNTNMGYYGFNKTAYSKLERAQTPDDKNAVRAVCVKTGEKYGIEKVIETFKANTIKPNTIYQVSFDYYINSTQVPTFWVQIVDLDWRVIVEFNAKSVEVQKWNNIEFNAKSKDFLQVNMPLRLFVCVDKPNTVEGDYITIQNLQLHETDLPNEWVPALEDQTAGTPNNDDVQLFDAAQLVPIHTETTSVTVASNIITITTTGEWGGAKYDVTELVRGKEIFISGSREDIGGGSSSSTALQIKITNANDTKTYVSTGNGVKVPSEVKSVIVELVANNSSSVLDTPKTVVFTDVMLNFGNRPYPWRPYDPSTAIVPKPEPVSSYIQRAMINLTAPLRSCGLINPVRDRIVRTGTKDAYKWKVHRRVGVQVLNGTESWEVSFVQGSYIRFALINNDLYDIAGPRMCDGLPYESVYDNTMTHECVHSSLGDGRIGITVLLSRLATSDVAGFKSWLTSNNLTVLYGKAQIDYEDLDATSQRQLSAIEAYNSEHTTYMYTMDSVNPELLVEYTGFGRYLFIAMLAADIEQLRNMDNSVKLVERFLTQFVPYYITPVVSGEVAQQEITGTHHMGVIVTESKIYTLVQYRSDNLTPQ